MKKIPAFPAVFRALAFAVPALTSEGEIVHQRPGLKGGLDEAAAVLLRLVAVRP